MRWVRWVNNRAARVLDYMHRAALWRSLGLTAPDWDGIERRAIVMREEDGTQVSWRDVRTLMVEMGKTWNCGVSLEVLPAPIDRAAQHLYFRIVFKRRRTTEERVWERAEGFYWPTVNFRTVPQGVVAAMYNLDRILDDEKGLAEQAAFL